MRQSKHWSPRQEGQRFSHNFIIFTYLVEILRHRSVKAYYITGDFFQILKYLKKYLLKIQHNGPLKMA